MTQQPGDKFGNYRLLRQLGSGGYADVWLAKHTLMETEAAIKILKVKLFDNTEQEMYLQEARKTARLDHPNVVRVLECDIEQNIPFLVLNYAPNGTLRGRHPRGICVPLDTVVLYTKQIASGLQYVHDRRLIHRDVKPENLLLGPQNEIWLSDFGIALVAQSIQYQKTQDIMGTLGYMAPEQAEGKPIASSDQYALAVIIYEWLYGSLPFSGNFGEILSQQRLKKLTLRDKMPNLPLAVEQTVLRALSFDLSDRFPNIQEFAETLERAAKEKEKDVKVDAEPTHAPIPPQQPPKSPDPTVINEPKINANEHIPSPPNGNHVAPPESPPPSGMGNQSPPKDQIKWWEVGPQQPNFPPTGFHGGPTLHHQPPFSPPRVQETVKPPMRKRRFDNNFHRLTKNRVFLAWGAIGDLFFALFFYFWSKDGNVGVLSFMFLYIIRLLCASAARASIARPLAWLLTLSWAVGILALIAVIQSTVFAFALLALVPFWFLHDYAYAWRKPAK